MKQYVLDALELPGLTDTEKACVRAIANYGHFMQPYLSAANKWTIGTDYEEMDLGYDDVDEDGVNDAEAARTGAWTESRPHSSASLVGGVFVTP